jgi:lysozyme family protein
MPSDEGVSTPLPPGMFARLATAARYAISGVAPQTWFGPQQPLAPMAPPEVKGRQFDYPFGVNIDYTPRSNQSIGFAELRALADALPLLRTIIETRKDQIAAGAFSVRMRDPTQKSAAAAARIQTILAFLARPDRRRSFASWLRMLLEEMLVIDAATIYPRLNRAGALYSLDIIDGSTITPLVGEDGRAPEPPDPAYQQVLHGIPAADFSCDELLYLPRNLRAHRLYGMSPVEQIALTINIALRRDAATLDYYRAGSIPDSFATLPKEWSVDQIRQFQDYFDALMSGNSSRRRMLKFMPADFHLQETRQPPEALAIYGDQYWHPLDADALPCGLDHCVVDDAFNSGPSSALRRWSKISAMGSPAAKIHAYSKLRLSFLEGLRGWKAFGRGWSSRVAGVEAESLKMVESGLAQSGVAAAKSGALRSAAAARSAKTLLGAPVGPPSSDDDYGALEASEASARARSMAALLFAATFGAYGLNRFGLPEDLRASAALVVALGAAGGLGVVWNLWNWRAHRARSAALAALACEPPNRA